MPAPEPESFKRFADRCSVPEDCVVAARELLSSLCPDLSQCASQGRRRGISYEWIETLLRQGIRDGRHRLILFVISRYLINIKNMSEAEALKEVEGFLQQSCKNYGNCSKIYESWIRNVLSKVKSGGWKPWTLERLKEKDPDLYSTVVESIGAKEEGAK